MTTNAWLTGGMFISRPGSQPKKKKKKGPPGTTGVVFVRQEETDPGRTSQKLSLDTSTPTESS